MERSTALKRLRKLLGKDFAYRINNSWKGTDAHQQAVARANAEKKTREAISDQMQARKEELLAADATYQQLLATYTTQRAAEKAAENAIPAKHRFSVGTANSLFFHVHADGDSWEEIFEKLEKKK